jgi:hypothetical protein
VQGVAADSRYGPQGTAGRLQSPEALPCSPRGLSGGGVWPERLEVASVDPVAAMERTGNGALKATAEQVRRLPTAAIMQRQPCAHFRVRAGVHFAVHDAQRLRTFTDSPLDRCAARFGYESNKQPEP